MLYIKHISVTGLLTSKLPPDPTLFKVFFLFFDRFTGRPGAYLRLLNRWKLEEVSHYFAFPWGYITAKHYGSKYF